MAKKSSKIKTFKDIKTFHDACEVLNIDPNWSINLPAELQMYHAGMDADLKRTIITRALNYVDNGHEEWEPDWTNLNQTKYYPWMRYKAGSGFSGSDCGCGSPSTGVGSRFCLKSSTLALYACEQFKEVFNTAFLSPKTLS